MVHYQRIPVSIKDCQELSDVDIVEKSKINLDYFSCLFERYEARLTRYIQRISSFSDTEIQDILQDSFIKVWRNLNMYKPSIKLSSWLYRIVRNETISQWRKKNSTRNIKAISLDAGSYNISTQEDPGTDASIIEPIVHKLPQKYKEVIILKFLEEMHYDEISDILKIPEGTVAVRINRAKKLLLKELNNIKNSQ